MLHCFAVFYNISNTNIDQIQRCSRLLCFRPPWNPHSGRGRQAMRTRADAINTRGDADRIYGGTSRMRFVTGGDIGSRFRRSAADAVRRGTPRSSICVCMCVCVYLYICIYIYTHICADIYIYIYIYIERERERFIYIHLYIYIYREREMY